MGAAEVVLNPVAIIRLGGPSPEQFKSGLMNEDKGTVGYNGDGTHFHCLIAFDLITVVKDLEKLEDVELTLTYAFNKEPATKPVWGVYVAGITESEEMTNELAWKLYTSLEGNVGQFPENVKAGDKKAFPVKKFINPDNLSPVKRYIWFRVEDSSPTTKENTIAGMSTNKEDHKLVITLDIPGSNLLP
jgi:hypothetical protein